MNQPIPIQQGATRRSALAKHRTLFILLALTLSLLALMIASLCLGRELLSPLEVVSVLVGQGTAEHKLFVELLRLPRVLVAVLAGAALSVSGAILQGIIRNPLASPDIMGISGGGAFAAVAFITYFSGAVSIRWMPVAALAGAALVSVIIYLLAWNKGVSSTRLVLIGIGISAATSSATMLMIILSPITAASKAYIWLTGSVYGASWENVYTLLPWVAVFIPLTLLYARRIDVQELGDNMAKGLGAHVQLHRSILLLFSVSLAGSAVAVVGAIGFVGLVGPHIARKLVGPANFRLIPAAALAGSLLVLFADTAARTVLMPLDIPAGVFTAGVGAPFFIYLLYKTRKD